MTHITTPNESNPLETPVVDIATLLIRARRSLRRAAFTLLAAACGVVGQLFLSNDWCCYTLPAAMLAVVVYRITMAIVVRIAPTARLQRVAAVLAIAIGLSCGAVFQVSPNWAFQEAFGIKPPRGISNLRIWRHYEGGPGEHSLIIEFTADDSAIHALTATFTQPEEDSNDAAALDELKRQWRASGQWMSAFEIFGGATHLNGRTTWNRIAPLVEPEIYFNRNRPDRALTPTLMLWDRGSNRVVVLHSRL